MPFPEVVARLANIDCEQYHADFRRQEKTYYMPDGRSHSELLPLGSEVIAQSFSADCVIAALRAIQGQQISYVQFLNQLQTAGCVGYFVYIAGKRAVYLARNGEFHVEHFPAGAAAAANRATTTGM